MTSIAKQLRRFQTFSKEEALKASAEYFHGDQLAASTFVGKYALKHMGAKGYRYHEATPAAMHQRLATHVARIEDSFAKSNTMQQISKLWSNGEEQMSSYDIYHKAMANFGYIVPQGSPMANIGSLQKDSLSNCVVVASPKDSISDIFAVSRDMANLFKRRAGVGLDVSTLRPDGMTVSNSAGTSSGAWKFSSHFSNVCIIIGQNGRRGALMVSMDVAHPDIALFAVMKRDLTQVTGANVSIKISDAFMQAVMDDKDWYCKWQRSSKEMSQQNSKKRKRFVEDAEGGWVTEQPLEEDSAEAKEEEDDIYTHWYNWNHEDVTSQTNLQVEVAATATCPAFTLWNDVNGRMVKRFRARELWHLINESATASGEPGLLFWDNYVNNLPANCYPNFKMVAVNPCAEIGLSPYDSCRLTTMFLKRFVLYPFTPQARFDFETFALMTRLAMRFMDNVVQLEIEAIQLILTTVKDKDEQELWTKMLKTATEGRRTGLGTHSLADTLACLNIRYDSDESISFCKHLFEVFRNEAYSESVNMAKERGAFPVFDWQLEKDNLFIKRLPKYLQTELATYGRRNISLLTMAPTGSVSILCQCSSGVEPVFQLFYTRRKKINHSEGKIGGARVDFKDASGDEWTEYPVFHHNVMDYIRSQKPELEKYIEDHVMNQPPELRPELIAKCLPSFFVTAADISPERRVQLQGAIQLSIDHGISSTINFPTETTIETIAATYELAWREGLKGVTVYRDKCRAGVLVTVQQKKPKEDEVKIVEPGSTCVDHSVCATIPRPEKLDCDIHRVRVEGKDWIVLVGMYQGRPFEVFGGIPSVEHHRQWEDASLAKGSITKRSNPPPMESIYTLKINDSDAFSFDVVKDFNNMEHAAMTRFLSGFLHHNVPLPTIIHQMTRDKRTSVTSFLNVMARVLKTYIKDGTVSADHCGVCGAKLVFEGGCCLCLACGGTNLCS